MGVAPSASATSASATAMIESVCGTSSSATASRVKAG